MLIAVSGFELRGAFLSKRGKIFNCGAYKNKLLLFQISTARLPIKGWEKQKIEFSLVCNYDVQCKKVSSPTS